MRTAKATSLIAGRLASRLHGWAWPKRALPQECDAYVLVRRPLGIGDLIMLSPFVLALVKQWRSGRVALVTDYLPFLDFGAGVEWIRPHEWRAEFSRTLVISPTYSLRHMPYLVRGSAYLGYFLSNIAISSFPAQPLTYDPKREHYLDRALGLLTMLNLNKDGLNFPPLIEQALPSSVVLPATYVCLAPYSNWKERQYPLEQFREIVRSLSRDVPVVLIGSPVPEELAFIARVEAGGRNVINLAGRLNLQQAAAVIRGARVFIGNDSGPAHMAFIGARASIAIFGCVGPDVRVPMMSSPANRILGMSAGGQCDLFPCYDGYNKPRCRRDYQCLRGTPASEVVGAALGLLN